ncbi:MAG: bifunctional (p)ppGpp synthetase/guanosine-3',5'-bis(diphosphate) 3'-pyrophosphohydrolase [Cryomorphaceae bacterium]|nr:MAG: bifunctional (p)ppGpp synthetase/guanosine-3',5'-bis(diphosphate) 3'-pyrophosphohydrolase [Cryomorphaceae bacterium]
MEIKVDTEQEKRDILRAYRGLLRVTKTKGKKDREMVRKAFDLALTAHKDMRRKSGEPYIYHPLAVARIVAEEIGLGTTSVIGALLHDTVEDTYITLEDIEHLFGPQVRKIIDGLTKIEGVFDHTTSIQAENFRKMLLTLSDDIRVILIKLADRLHNMRTLESMRRDKQLKIASETKFMYAPLAHRLGLYAIKSELEDLALKYTEPEVYEEIISKLKKTQAVRTRFINRFIIPIKRGLEASGFKFEIKGRTKSIFSIYNKMQEKKVSFEEVYDLFAIRVIIDTALENEKADCWRAYSVVTDYYKPNPDRLRDWISTPKANGYESLHTTVMSPTGKWVEVQIRTRRMDEISEKGFAAHWKYKEGGQQESGLDAWLTRIREMLENTNSDTLDFIDDFKLNLFADEIFVFTPKGDLFSLPMSATALDFAFEIHSQVGSSCLGAKVNNKLVPLSHELRSGDQVEIITSHKQKPKADWLNFVVTGKAKSKIKAALKEERKKIAEMGREMLERKLRNIKVDFLSINITELEKHYKVDSALEMYYQIAKGKIDLKKLRNYRVENGLIIFEEKKSEQKSAETLESLVQEGRTPNETLTIGDDMKQVDYSLAKCCNPIPGDDVFGFVTVNEGIKIHRVNCPNAVQLLGNYAYRAIKARWASQKANEFLATIRFSGIDDVGLVHSITSAISNELRVNMKSISFESNDGVFEGLISLYVYDTDHLHQLIRKLKRVQGVRSIQRVEADGGIAAE